MLNLVLCVALLSFLSLYAIFFDVERYVLVTVFATGFWLTMPGSPTPSVDKAFPHTPVRSQSVASPYLGRSECCAPTKKSRSGAILYGSTAANAAPVLAIPYQESPFEMSVSSMTAIMDQMSITNDSDIDSLVDLFASMTIRGRKKVRIAEWRNEYFGGMPHSRYDSEIRFNFS